MFHQNRFLRAVLNRNIYHKNVKNFKLFNKNFKFLSKKQLNIPIN